MAYYLVDNKFEIIKSISSKDYDKVVKFIDELK